MCVGNDRKKYRGLFVGNDRNKKPTEGIGCHEGTNRDLQVCEASFRF